MTLSATDMSDEAELGLMDTIKQEIDIGEEPTISGYHDTPRSWDSGVALDSVTALQMAEFQQVVDNLHRQVVQSPPPPPPYPFKYPAKNGSDLDTDSDLNQLLLTSSGGSGRLQYVGAGAHTYQPGTPKFETLNKTGCQSLPANGVIQTKIIDKIEHKYKSNQR